MKYTLAFIAIIACLFGLIQAVPNERYKRASIIVKCPTDISCESYVQALRDEARDKGYCIGYSAFEDAYNMASCPPLLLGCQKPGKEDLTKPYPDCCAKCEQ